MTQSTLHSFSYNFSSTRVPWAKRDKNTAEFRSHIEFAPPYGASRAAGNGAINSTKESLSRKVRTTGSVRRTSPNAPPRKTRNRKALRGQHASTQGRRYQDHRSQASSQALRHFPTARAYSMGLCFAPDRIAVFVSNDRYWLGHRFGSPPAAVVQIK
jgi:hypothetical protein